MPWSNQTGGGGNRSSGNGGGGPWGQQPRGGGPQPPDLEELLRRSQDRLRRVLPGGGGGRGLSPFALIGIVVVAAALIGYYFFTFRVEPNELGVVLRFGEMNRQAQPGLNFRLPYPIETVYKPQVTTVNRTTVGLVQDGRGGQSASDVAESLMLTADENIVDIDFQVQWIIADADDYLFNIQDPEGTVKAVAESAMREVVGRSNIQPLLTGARQTTESAVLALIQTTLDSYDAGITVREVTLQKVDPPSEVIAAFRDVQAARSDAERSSNEAQTYANQVVPQARGQALQILEEATAYHDQVIAEAQGQASRFVQIYDAYAAAPEVTRQRMYLESLQQVLGSTQNIIIEDGAGGANGIVPYLPLNQLRSTTPAPAANTQGVQR